MKNQVILILFLLSFLSCKDGSSNSELLAKVESLEVQLKEAEGKIASLQKAKEISYLKATSFFKHRSVADMLGDPWDSFINAPEFWETIYDVSPDDFRPPLSECEKGCVRVTTENIIECQKTGKDQAICMSTVRANERKCKARCNGFGDTDTEITAQ